MQRVHRIPPEFLLGHRQPDGKEQGRSEEQQQDRAGENRPHEISD